MGGLGILLASARKYPAAWDKILPLCSLGLQLRGRRGGREQKMRVPDSDASKSFTRPQFPPLGAGNQSRASHMLDKCSYTELYVAPSWMTIFKDKLEPPSRPQNPNPRLNPEIVYH